MEGAAVVRVARQQQAQLQQLRTRKVTHSQVRKLATLLRMQAQARGQCQPVQLLRLAKVTRAMIHRGLRAKKGHLWGRR